MPLSDLKPLIADSDYNKIALGGFNVINMEMIIGVIEAAEIIETPAILNIHPDQLKYTSMDILAEIVKEAASGSNIPVVLHLDYSDNIAILRQAISCGFTSLMYVAPGDHSFEKTLEETRIAADLAHQNGLMIESEFRTGGSSSITDPEKAKVFVRETGVDVLSPQIGTVHGGGKANLDLEALKEIKRKADCYISLHGGSGVEDNVLQEAIRSGINKVSVYSQISNHAINNIKDQFKSGASPDMVETSGLIKDSIKDMAMQRLTVLSLKNTAPFKPESIQEGKVTDSIEDLVRDVTKRVMKRLK